MTLRLINVKQSPTVQDVYVHIHKMSTEFIRLCVCSKEYKHVQHNYNIQCTYVKGIHSVYLCWTIHICIIF